MFLRSRHAVSCVRLQHRAASTAQNDPPSAGPTTHFGFQDVPEQEKASLVGKVFSNVASNYDIMNDAMSAGVHRLWKDYFVKQLAPMPGIRLLDVAGGTGDIAFRCMEHSRQYRPALTGPTEVYVCDINPNMLQVGKQKAQQFSFQRDESMHWLTGDAEQLPLPSNTFDAYTIAFGIRNVTHIDAALREAWRVLKPGGRLMVLEFSQVEDRILRKLYDAYSFEVIPVLGHLIAGDMPSYQYLVESIRKFPDQVSFANMIGEAGFTGVTYENLTFGVTALHSGFKL